MSRRDRIRAQLADLKMPGALESLDEILSGIDAGAVTAAEAIERVLGSQIALRNARRLEAAMRSSRLPAVKTLADFDFAFQPSLKREQVESLHELGFVERRENVVFLGPPGVGKSHLAISLAVAAAEHGRARLLRHSRRAHPLARGRTGRWQAHAADEDADLPLGTGGRRDRLCADQPHRCHALLPADEPPLRARRDRAHQQQELRGVGRDLR
jgi:hypothetical protein